MATGEVEELRKELRACGVEIERLRSRLRLADAVIRSGDTAALTAEDREAVEGAADLIDNKTCGDSSTLRGLLERLGGGR